jgi:CspA family cold shock protein
MSSNGVIRRVVRERGFGFIASHGGKDIFFHQSQLQGVDFSTLQEGQSVIYKVGLSAKGLEAVDVKLAARSLHGLGGMARM